MASNSNVVILPYVTVQHDVSNVIEDIRDGIVSSGSEDVWVSCYHEGRPSVHGKVRIARSNEGTHGLSFEARAGIEWLGNSTAEFRVGCPSLDIQPTSIRLPKHFYRTPESHSGRKITVFDISPDSKTFATGYGDGSIVLSPTAISSSASRSIRTGKPHLSTVLSLRFFPSSVVLLSASSDYSLKIHDAKLMSPTANGISSDAVSSTSSSITPVRSLQAHSAGVTGCAIVDRGRNVLSFGRDATARLWNVAEGKEVVGRRWGAERGTPILCGCIGVLSSGLRDEQSVTLDGEVGTEDKVVFMGLQDGSVRAYELRTGRSIFYHPPTIFPSPPGEGSVDKASPIDSIATDGESGLLVAGTRDGHVLVWNLKERLERIRALEAASQTVATLHLSPVIVFRRNTAGIEALFVISPASSTSDDGSSILVGSVDGLSCHVRVGLNGSVAVMEEFIGVEAGDGIRGVKVLNEEDGLESIWWAADDGIRKY